MADDAQAASCSGCGRDLSPDGECHDCAGGEADGVAAAGARRLSPSPANGKGLWEAAFASRGDHELRSEGDGPGEAGWAPPAPIGDRADQPVASGGPGQLWTPTAPAGPARSAAPGPDGAAAASGPVVDVSEADPATGPGEGDDEAVAVNGAGEGDDEAVAANGAGEADDEAVAVNGAGEADDEAVAVNGAVAGPSSTVPDRPVPDAEAGLPEEADPDADTGETALDGPPLAWSPGEAPFLEGRVEEIDELHEFDEDDDLEGDPRRQAVWAALALVVVLVVIVGGVLVTMKAGGSHSGTNVATGSGPTVSTKGAAAGAATTTTGSATTAASTTVPPTTAAPTTVPATATAFSRLATKDTSGILRLQATSCRGGASGKAVLIGPDLALTAAHLVEGAGVVALNSTQVDHGGQVIGIDKAHDVALLKTTAAFPGHRFAVASAEPGTAGKVAALSFAPLSPVVAEDGAVEATGQRVPIAGQDRTGLLRASLAVPNGETGAPVVDAANQLVGVVAAGGESKAPTLVAGTAGLASTISGWQVQPMSPAPPTCSGLSGHPTVVNVDGSVSSPYSRAIATTLSTYFSAINQAQWNLAWAQYTPTEQRATGSEQRLINGDQSSFNFDAHVTGIRAYSSSIELTTVKFTSVQQPESSPNHNGDLCDNWTLTYSMVDSGGTWLIGGVVSGPGGPFQAC